MKDQIFISQKLVHQFRFYFIDTKRAQALVELVLPFDYKKALSIYYSKFICGQFNEMEKYHR